MNISDVGLKLIAKWEGKRNRLYNDPAGHCTIGYGKLVHLGPCDGRANEAPYRNGLTDEECLNLLKTDVNNFAAQVEAVLRVPVSQTQFDALVSLAYNIGIGAFSTSQLLILLNAGDYAGAAPQFLRWNRASVGGKLTELPGLTSRRKEEMALFGTSAPICAEATRSQKGAWVTADKLNLRTGPGTSFPIIGQLTRGTNVGVLNVKDGWAKVGEQLFVSAEWLSYKEVEAPSTVRVTNANYPTETTTLPVVQLFNATPLFIGVHDLPTPDQLGQVWKDTSKRGLVVHANLVTDDPPPLEWVRDHRRNGGIYVQRLDWTWDDTLPPIYEAGAFGDQVLRFVEKMNGEIDFLQIGNEPDLAHKSYPQLEPEHVAQVFNSVARRVSALWPNIKCGPAPIGWLNWAYGNYMHPAEYDRRKWAGIDPNVCKAVFFHAYSQTINHDPNGMMELPQNVFYSERVIENQLSTMPNWALGLTRIWTECNPIAHPQSGEWPDNDQIMNWMRRIVGYAKDQRMTGVAFFRLQNHDAWGRSYRFDNKGRVLEAIRAAQ